MFRTSIVLGMALLLSSMACASDADHDSRALSAAEQKNFFPLVCKKQIPHGKDDNCAGVIGYPDGAPVEDKTSLSLDAVVYGSFTQANADQAYVTYSVSFEPHANDFGGGILFERAAGKWKLVRWYPGGQMDHCLALPVADVQNMLCLTGYTGQGEVDSSVWQRRVPRNGDSGPFWKASIGVLKAQDGRESGNSNYQCTLKRAKDEAVLLSIGDLKRSKAPGFFAESSVIYASARDVGASCRKQQFADVEETKGVVRYKLVGGRVVTVTSAKFAAADY